MARGAPRGSLWARVPFAAPAGYRRWLGDSGSLTRRIQSRCPAFSVRLVSQGRRRAGRDAADPGGGRARGLLVREVVLYCGGAPVVYARSVIRGRDLRGPWRFLARLGNQPLGEALFADPRVRREPLTFRRLRGREALARRIGAVLGARPPALWARRSPFVRDGSPILVTEVFLPEILAL